SWWFGASSYKAAPKGPPPSLVQHDASHRRLHDTMPMSDRIIVATFNDANAAYETASALKDLKKAGAPGAADFKLKAGGMIKKDHGGNVSLVESKDRPLLGTAVGATTGLLIGLLGGAPGAALGATLGATTGMSADALMAAVDSDFIDEVK